MGPTAAIDVLIREALAAATSRQVERESLDHGQLARVRAQPSIVASLIHRL